MKCPVHGVYFMLPDGSRHCYLGCDWRGQAVLRLPPSDWLKDAYRLALNTTVFIDGPEEKVWRQTKNKRRNRARFRARERRRLSGSSEPAPAVLPALAPVAAVKALPRPDQPMGPAVPHRPAGEPGPEADLIAAMRKLARGKIIPIDYMEMILPPDWTQEERAFLEEMTRVIAFNQSNPEPEPEPDILAATRDIARGS